MFYELHLQAEPAVVTKVLAVVLANSFHFELFVLPELSFEQLKSQCLH